MLNINTKPSDWKAATLGEVVFPVSETFDFKNTKKIHFLNTGDILEGKLLHNNLSDISILPGQAKKSFQKNDILFSEIRPANKRYMFVNFDSSNSVASTKLMVLRGKENIDMSFIYKFITSNIILREFQNIAESRSGTFPQITFDSIANFPIFLPPLPEQRAIAAVLSSLDDKIELLRQENETLEQIGQNLFKEWFGKYSVDNPEELPEGWRVGKLGEITNLKSGYAFKSNDFIEKNNKKVLKIKDLQGKGKVDLSSVSSVADEIVKLERVKFFKLSKGDIVLAMSGNTTGKIGVVPEYENELYLNQRVGKFFLKYQKWNSFLYFFLMANDYEEKILNMGYGSAQPNINPSQIENIDIIFAENKLLDEYLKIADLLFDKVLKNYYQIKTLSKNRDILLPKLMSGEVRVKN